MRVVICQCKAAGLIFPEAYDGLTKALSGGFDLVCVDDLCAMAAARDKRLLDWGREPITICACYDRAIRAIFERAGCVLPSSAVVLNLRIAKSIDEIVNRLSRSTSSECHTDFIQAAEGNWPAWFPVIDYSRCKNCKQCVNFCLFGVYEWTPENKVRVVRPRSCKNGCPACARVCPHAAIIFPKYDKTPINGQSVDESLWRQQCRDSAELLKHRLSGGIYQFLRDRHPGDGPRPQPHDLQSLKAKLDIPDDLLDSSEELR